MLTYNFSDQTGPIYKCLYEFIKKDIQSNTLKAGEKLPSKRMLAKNLGISTITVENAYDQLIGEGYIYSLPKKGYFVANISNHFQSKLPIYNELNIQLPATRNNDFFDFSSNQIDSNYFPFSIWAKITRETISTRKRELLENSPCGGVHELRQAIAKHLLSFRGMNVDPNQIIIGAGTEYLYSLLIKLLGADKIYGIENPGYKKIAQVYKSNSVCYMLAKLDGNGIIIDDLRTSNIQIAHISPTHHFPTGITMPISRRYELLSWANEYEDRYIIEDDYDSEFRLNGKPIPPLMSIDASQKVIYMNTFSKSLASTIRISYMVLPEHLANEFYKRLSFYSCTVSTFEQYTLADFISKGYFEKHINRSRLHYVKKRAAILDLIKKKFGEDECQIIENDSGLHFILKFNTIYSDVEVKQRLAKKHINIRAITEFNMDGSASDMHQFILNYSNIDTEKLSDILEIVRNTILRMPQ